MVFSGHVVRSFVFFGGLAFPATWGGAAASGSLQTQLDKFSFKHGVHVFNRIHKEMNL